MKIPYIVARTAITQPKYEANCSGPIEKLVIPSIERFAESPVVPLGLACRTWRARVSDLNLPEPDPGEQALHETMPLAQLRERIHGASAHQAEVPDIDRYRLVAKPIDHAIEHMCGQTLKLGLALAGRSAGIDDVIALLPASDEVDDHLRRVLQIGVNHHHRAPPGMVYPCSHSNFFAEIARQ